MNALILLSLLGLLETYINSQDTCNYSMYCLKDFGKSCMKVTATEAPGIYKIGYHECNSQRLSYCNVYDGLLQPSNYKSECQKRPDDILSYPGGRCNKDTDCRNGICIDNICKDSEMYKECFRDESCPIGSACFFDAKYQGTCKPLGTVNDACTKSTECQINLVCAFNNCVKMYSLKNEEIITSYLGKMKEKLDVLCESGFAVEFKKEIICASIINIGSPQDKCKEDCEYKLKGSTVRVPNSCRCGYNDKRSKHCILGSGDPQFIQFIQKKKKLINDESYWKYCHTIERYSDNYCIEKLKTQRSVAFRRSVQEYNNLKISVLEYHRLINADACIKTVVFDYNTLPILPDRRKCAKFSCDDTIGNCAEGTNPLNEEGDSVKIKLNDKLCEEEKMCLMSSSEKGIDFIYENYTVTGTCGKKPYKSNIHLPGEDCLQSSDCFNSKCSPDHKCEGKNLNEECTSHAECKVGLYCNSTNYCQRQKKQGEYCESSWDCQNYLGCYSNPGSLDNHCIPFGQVGDIDISQIKAKWKSDTDFHREYDPSEIGTNLMCKSGQTSVNQKRCGTYQYDTSMVLMTKLNSGQLIECQADEDCYYIDNYGVKTNRKCECGYNADGKGYCPLPNSINQDEWERLNQYKSELTDNQCHTLSRFDCYLNRPTKVMKALEFTTIKAHLFYDAVPCAYKVLNRNWIQINRFLFLIVILFT